ncbi:unnamed protein product, partial [Meganyctiphanes norvegica]
MGLKGLRVVVLSGEGGVPCEECGWTGSRGDGGSGTAGAPQACSKCGGATPITQQPSPLNGHVVPHQSTYQADHYITQEPIRVVLLGAKEVGKTSLVKQFVSQEFSHKYEATTTRTTYSPSVFVNDHLCQLTIADLPPIQNFPHSSFEEWNDYRFFGLRCAMAYVFIFDLTCPDSFAHIKALRDQMYDSRDMREVGVVVVGNKKDLVDTSEGREKRDIASFVKKQWKASYVEVSAKCNWHVIAAFKELIVAFEEAQQNRDGRHHNLHELHEAIEHSKCTIL